MLHLEPVSKLLDVLTSYDRITPLKVFKREVYHVPLAPVTEPEVNRRAVLGCCKHQLGHYSGDIDLLRSLWFLRLVLLREVELLLFVVLSDAVLFLEHSPCLRSESLYHRPRRSHLSQYVVNCPAGDVIGKVIDLSQQLSLFTVYVKPLPQPCSHHRCADVNEN